MAQMQNEKADPVNFAAIQNATADVKACVEDEKLSASELESMGFAELRKELCSKYVPCSGASTKVALLDLYAQDWLTAREQLPLYKLRKRLGSIVSPFANNVIDIPAASFRKEVGLLACQNTECLNSEDGHTAFCVCSACKGPAYCSRECQRRAWKQQHKRECASMKKKHEEKEASNASMKALEDKLMNILKSREEEGSDDDYDNNEEEEEEEEGEFSAEELRTLDEQGVKPWDPQAAEIIAALCD